MDGGKPKENKGIKFSVVSLAYFSFPKHFAGCPEVFECFLKKLIVLFRFSYVFHRKSAMIVEVRMSTRPPPLPKQKAKQQNDS